MQFKQASISVIGLGYIGLPTAATLASRKIKTIGIDVNKQVVDKVNQGCIHIEEPGLAEMVSTVVENGYLRASQTPEMADVFVIAVPTPFKENSIPDLKYIQAACQSIASVLRPGNLIILESTSPVGTTLQLSKWLSQARTDLIFPHQDTNNPEINIAYCPERVLPGKTLQELVENHRVIGGMTKNCAASAAKFYKQFVTGECMLTNAHTAEMCKLVENAYRDVNIAFANELSNICDGCDVNAWELIKLANYHPRVDILNPGIGVGGHCIAVDPWFLVSKDKQNTSLIQQARQINDTMPQYIVEKIIARYDELKPKGIICLGLAFKPNVDDFRSSPAVEIIQSLIENIKNDIFIVEPYLQQLPENLAKYSNVKLISLGEALTSVGMFVGLVRHDHFVEAFQAHTIPAKKVIDFVQIF